MKKMILLLVLILGILGGMGCNINIGVELSPEITTLFPNTVMSNLPFTLTIEGNYFTADSIIQLNGKDMSTEFSSSSLLTCRVPAGETALDTTVAEESMSVQVIERGGGVRQSATKTVTLQHAPVFGASTRAIYTTDSNHVWWRSLKLVADQKPTLYVLWNEEVAVTVRDGAPTQPHTSGRRPVRDDMVGKLGISTDSGATWETPKTMPSQCRYFLPRNGKLYVFANEMDRILRYVSEDSGDSWTQTEVPIQADNDFNYYALAEDAYGALVLVYATSNDYYDLTLHTLYSSDYGDTWEPSGQTYFDNSHSQTIDWMRMDSDMNLYIGYSYLYGRYAFSGMYTSSDRGVTFQQCDNCGHGAFSSGFAMADGKFHMLYYSMYLPYMYHLEYSAHSNFGTVLEYSHRPDEDYSYGADMAMDAGGNLYILWENKMIRSINAGITWTDPSEFAVMPESGYFSDHRLAVHDDQDPAFYMVWSHDNQIYFETAGNK
ncbi:MAG: hypothetical protein GY765_28300 [bacterium]|nr:hypothetical protein [bacterium]